MNENYFANEETKPKIEIQGERVYEEPMLPTSVRTVAAPPPAPAAIVAHKHTTRPIGAAVAKLTAPASTYRQSDRLYQEILSENHCRSYTAECVRRRVLEADQDGQFVNEYRQVAATSVLLINKRTDVVLAYMIVADDEHSPDRLYGELHGLERARRINSRFARRFTGPQALIEAVDVKQIIDEDIRQSSSSWEAQQVILEAFRQT